MTILSSLCCPILTSQEGYLVTVTSVVGHEGCTGDLSRLRDVVRS